jgi:hypothetical protein
VSRPRLPSNFTRLPVFCGIGVSREGVRSAPTLSAPLDTLARWRPPSRHASLPQGTSDAAPKWFVARALGTGGRAAAPMRPKYGHVMTSLMEGVRS